MDGENDALDGISAEDLARIDAECQAPRPDPPPAAVAPPPHLRGLNSAQIRAATVPPDQPLSIIAGAGTGKTRTLVARILNIVMHHGAQRSSILALTFTRSAALEMARRVGQELGPRASTVRVSTFHALALSLCKRFHAALGLPAAFPLYTARQLRRLCTDALRAWAEREGAGPSGALNKHVLREEAGRLSRALAVARAKGLDRRGWSDCARFVDDHVARAMKERGALDFQGLLRAATRLLAQHAPAQRSVRARVRFLLVDEFQDSNRLQWALLVALSAHTRGVTVVGDDDQCIYGFAGAAGVAGFDWFDEVFWPVERVALEQNYRCFSSLLHVSNSVMAAAPAASRRRKRLWTTRPRGQPRVDACECRTEACEMALLCRMLSLRHAGGTAWEDMAVLCRTNSAVRCVAAALRHAGLPTLGDDDRGVIRDGAVSRMRALWRLCLHPRDDAAFHEACFGVGAFLSPDARAAVRKVSALHRMAHLDIAEAVAALKRGQPTSLAAVAATPVETAPSFGTALSPPRGGADANTAVRELAASLPARDRHALARMASVVRGLRERAGVLTLPALVDRTARMAPLAFRAPPAPAEGGQSRKRGRVAAPAASTSTADVDSGDSAGSSDADDAAAARRRRRTRPQRRRRQVLSFLTARAKAFERRLAATNAESGDAVAGMTYSQCSLSSSAPESGELSPRLHRLAAFVSDVDMLCEEVSHCGERGAEAGAAATAPTLGICVSTIHRAKGLEWRLVVIPFAVEGTLPLERSRDPLAPIRSDGDDAVQRRARDHQHRQEALEEERRLAYVALTRAQQAAVVTWSMQSEDGRVQARSPFLAGVEAGDITWHKQYEERLHAVGELPAVDGRALLAAGRAE